jgi:transcriptional regulator with XRE-family HTH domain
MCLNQFGRLVKGRVQPFWVSDIYQSGIHSDGMLTRIGARRPIRLYLAEWREHKGLTQQALADRLETTDVTISRWETGKRQPNLDAQAAIAEALGIDPFDLRRHPDQPSADALLRDQPPEVRDQAIRLIQAIRR